MAQFDENKSSLEARLILARYKLAIREKFSQKGSKTECIYIPSIRTLIGIEATNSEFMDLISTATTIKIKIMKEVIQEKPNLITQYELACEFAIMLKQVNRSWKNIDRYNFADYRLLQVYRKFCSLVLLRKEEANQLSDKMAQEFALSQNTCAANFSEINRRLPDQLSVAIVSHSSTAGSSQGARVARLTLEMIARYL